MAFSQVECTEPELWSDLFSVEGHGIPKLFWERWQNCAKYSEKNILLIVDDKWWGMWIFSFWMLNFSLLYNELFQEKFVRLEKIRI